MKQTEKQCSPQTQALLPLGSHDQSKHPIVSRVGKILNTGTKGRLQRDTSHNNPTLVTRTQSRFAEVNWDLTVGTRSSVILSLVPFRQCSSGHLTPMGLHIDRPSPDSKGHCQPCLYWASQPSDPEDLRGGTCWAQVLSIGLCFLMV